MNVGKYNSSNSVTQNVSYRQTADVYANSYSYARSTIEICLLSPSLSNIIIFLKVVDKLFLEIYRGQNFLSIFEIIIKLSEIILSASWIDTTNFFRNFVLLRAYSSRYTCQQHDIPPEGLHQLRRTTRWYRRRMVRLAKLGSQLGRQRTLGDLGQKNKSASKRTLENETGRVFVVMN